MVKPKISTMNDLSKAIGVSRPTLARYFEDEKAVLPSTARKIKDGLAKVDYVYNFLATRQNRKSTGLIGVVVPHFEDLFYASLLESIEAAASAAGFTMITQSSHGDPFSQEQAMRKLRSMSVDGAIVAPLAAQGHHEIFLAAGADFPIVFVDARPPQPLSGSDFIGTRNTQSIGIMVDYLCRTGPPPVFLAMPLLNSNALERREAYVQQMHQRGLPEQIMDVPGDASSWQFERYGFEVMDAHLAQGRYVDATILCANDRIAIGAIRAANMHGLFARGTGVGSQLRIAGHDDHPLSRYIFPALTTVAQQVAGLAGDAVGTLLKRIEHGQDGKPIVLLRDGVLKLRESA
ncbi:LacI family DNA-binding transcriptional regulator [Roseobacter fucihabitans]|nr:LacI family DNA-binding transcriptional regulator [Roseobacter litoralis]